MWTGFSSEIGTKLRDWAVGQAGGSCYSWAALSSSDSKTRYLCSTLSFLFADEAHNLDFFYEQAQDYPVDLYYLMDLSKSMEDDKEKLSALGDLLAATMQNITSNFRLGFGSFVDKVVMPYVSTVPRK